ncbi:tyrosine-type recombinase/integrase [Azonexus fungiphilus]|uniref:tyrosine-type recombinase/integrase n=1 Tax=Azonexus fungiphilus TaxID=146940 RepID=UPI00156BA3A5|nr:tyrosine-type recombinase/integrase [Azonexus fungiphilus]
MDYRQIIDQLPVCEHTKVNRRCALVHVLTHLGGNLIGSVRPLQVGKAIREIAAVSPQTAKRALFEARAFFNEAILAGVINTNPAAPIKPPKVSVSRRRMSLENWRKIRDWSVLNQPPWVPMMLDLALVTGQRRSDLSRMRFADVWDGCLHIEQNKTGTRLALPVELRLEAIGRSISEVIDACRSYAEIGDTFLRRKSGLPLVDASLSARFEEAREGSGLHWEVGTPPSLHECRSLSERLYRVQGIDTKTLLGHKHQSMTDAYNDDRGLSSGQWLRLQLPP